MELRDWSCLSLTRVHISQIRLLSSSGALLLSSFSYLSLSPSSPAGPLHPRPSGRRPSISSPPFSQSCPASLLTPISPSIRRRNSFFFRLYQYWAMYP
ncbi:uncharacterized protein BO88DRAFT_44514 [Aspergillus vadensis CBS 113365]|uniref:Uncharacterized protein n=1 Tax=Aspergillus vadensis (strain CBS 113365 / IMI 142717 / IBT 24658) TaxID=1448311 RepID=A0A319B9I9_ASPVC|nr:hypothetical protein BO88DRAFT_44514 [Aspergillus vadensis CBS 113365]PYH69225.1 hypothetical protein BO88DRAFT_44514 [Aspergillus vadensis CBS 113365]